MRQIFVAMCSGLLALSTCRGDAVHQFDLGSTRSLTAGIPFDHITGVDVAYNSMRNEYLVVYSYKNEIFAPSQQIHAARIGANGEYIANYGSISTGLDSPCYEPSVDYDPVLDRYLIAWSYYIDQGTTGRFQNVWARFVPYDGPTSADAAWPVTLATLAAPYIYGYPKVVLNPDTRKFLVLADRGPASTQSQPPPFDEVVGDLIDADGPGTIDLLPLDLSIKNATRHTRKPDAVYNPDMQEFMVVYQRANEIDHSIVDIFCSRLSGDSLFHAIAPIGVAAWPAMEFYPHVAYNTKARDYYVMWSASSASQTDLYGRFVSALGTPGTVQQLNDTSLNGYADIAYGGRADGYLITLNTLQPGTGNTFLWGRYMSADGVLFPGTVVDRLDGAYPFLAVAAGKGEWSIMASRGAAPSPEVLFTRMIWPRRADMSWMMLLLGDE